MSASIKAFLVALFFIALTSCGGGGNSGGSGGGGLPTNSPSNPPLPTLAVQSQRTFFDGGPQSTAHRMEVSISYSGSSSQAIVPVLELQSGQFNLVSDASWVGNRVEFTLESDEGLGVGRFTESFRLRLCTSASCDRVYPGSTLDDEIILFARVPDWANYQGDAAHTGSVPLLYDATQATAIWEWVQDDIGAGFSTNVPLTASTFGTVYTTTMEFGVNVALFSITIFGDTDRRQSLGVLDDFSGPALALEDDFYSSVAVTGVERTFDVNSVFIFDGDLVDTGSQKGDFQTQGGDFYQPTYFDDHFYIAAGLYGNVVYAFRAEDGSLAWSGEGSTGNFITGQAPAVDENYVYFYSGALDVFRRSDGKLIKSIENPYHVSNGMSYLGSPVLDGQGRAYLFSSTLPGTNHRPIVAFDIDAATLLWKSSEKYQIQPAYKDGMLYAVRRTGTVDAIDPDTGAIVWSWDPPNGEAPYGNIVVAGRTLFMSTRSRIYGISIDGATRSVEFSQPGKGFLSISPDHRLLVSQPGRIKAFSFVEDRFEEVPIG